MRVRRKRMLWKTLSIQSSDDARYLSSAWQSSHAAFGPNRVFTLNRYGGGGDLETNLPWSSLRMLFRHAGIPLRRDKWVLDTVCLEERVKIWDAEDTTQ